MVEHIEMLARIGASAMAETVVTAHDFASAALDLQGISIFLLKIVFSSACCCATACSGGIATFTAYGCHNRVASFWKCR